MTDYLITNQALLDDPGRMAPWLQALGEAGVEYRGPYKLDDATWRDQLTGGDRVLALGGDGTVSSASACCVGAAALLAVLPAGTANDFARSLGIDAANAIEVVRRGSERRVDVGRLDDGLFLNVTHIGLGAEVSIHLSGSDKRRWGPWSYLRQLLRRLLHRRGFKGKLEFDGRTVYARWLEIAIANGPSFGGGHRIEHADLASGALTMVAVRQRPLPRLILAILAAKLGFPRNPKLLRIERVQNLWLHTRKKLAVTADGEKRTPRRLHCCVEPAALRVLCPPATENRVKDLTDHAGPST